MGPHEYARALLRRVREHTANHPTDEALWSADALIDAAALVAAAETGANLLRMALVGQAVRDALGSSNRARLTKREVLALLDAALAQPMPADPMTAAEYEAEVARVHADTDAGNERHIVACLMGLAEEVGEVTNVIKKVVHYGLPLDRSALVLEGGDVLCWLTALAQAHGITLAEMMAASATKLRARFPRGYNRADAIARADEKGAA